MKYDYEIKNDKLLREAYNAGRRQGYQQLDENLGKIVRGIKSFFGRGGRGANNMIGGTPVPPTSIRPANWTGLNQAGDAMLNAYREFLAILRSMGIQPGGARASSLGSFLAAPSAGTLNSLNRVMKQWGLQLIPGPDGFMIWVDLNGNPANLSLYMLADGTPGPNYEWINQMLEIFNQYPMENF